MCVYDCILHPFLPSLSLSLSPSPSIVAQVSKIFDPFMYLSLPLPVKKTRKMELHVIYADPLKPIVKVTTPLNDVIIITRGPLLIFILDPSVFISGSKKGDRWSPKEGTIRADYDKRGHGMCIQWNPSLIRTPLVQSVLNSEVSSFQRLLSTQCDI